MRSHAAHGSRWIQGAVALSVVVALGGSILSALSGAPSDTLYIKLGDLRSRAAEVREVAHNARAERLTPTYVRAQAGEQLAPRIEKLRDDLARSEGRSEPGAAAARAAAARAAAERLLSATRALAEHGDTPPAAAPLEAEAGAVVDALLLLERAARPQ
jgi:hypothetical protein